MKSIIAYISASRHVVDILRPNLKSRNLDVKIKIFYGLIKGYLKATDFSNLK